MEPTAWAQVGPPKPEMEKSLHETVRGTSLETLTRYALACERVHTVDACATVLAWIAEA